MDEAAFTAFYRCHAEAVLAFLSRRTGNAELAADVTAEVFAEVLRRPGRVGPDERAWLLAVARNKAVDAHRRGHAEDRARRRLGVRPVALGESDRALIDALGSDVEAAVAELPADQREAVRGRVLEDLAYDELARRAAVSPAAMRQRVARGLATVRKRMEQQ